MKEHWMKKLIVCVLMLAVVLAAVGIAGAAEVVHTEEIDWPFVLNSAASNSHTIRLSKNAYINDNFIAQYDPKVLVYEATSQSSNTSVSLMIKNNMPQIEFTANENSHGDIIEASAETTAEKAVANYKLLIPAVAKEPSVNAASGAVLTKIDKGIYEISVKEGETLTVTANYEKPNGGTPDMNYKWTLARSEQQNGSANSFTFTVGAEHNEADLVLFVQSTQYPDALDNPIFKLKVEPKPETLLTEAIVNGGNPAILYAYPHNMTTQEAKDFSSKYFSGYTNEELAQRYGFKVETDQNFEIVSDELKLGAKIAARLLVKPVSKNAEGKSIKIAMYLKATGETVYEREYVFTLIAERSLFEIVTNSEYRHEYVSGRGDVLTVAKGSDLTIKLGYQGVGQTMNASYTWRDKLNGGAVLGTGNAYTLTDIQTAKEILCEVKNGSNRVETIFFNIEVDETLALKPAVKVEEQTEEQKQNNTVTVVVPDEVIEQVIDNAASTVVELPVAEAPIGQQTAVTTAKVSEKAIEKLAETNKAIAVPLDHAEVVMQPEVVKQIANSVTAGAEIEIQVEQKKPQEALNTTQLQAVANQKVAAVITADVFMKEDNKRTKIDFQGKVTLKVPFTPPAGESGHDYVIVYVASNGQTETLATYYTNGYLVFETTHFSDFVIATRAANAPVVAVPKTGDNAAPWLWMVCMTLTAGCALFLVKRRQNA